jgi:hypothetical protein
LPFSVNEKFFAVLERKKKTRICPLLIKHLKQVLVDSAIINSNDLSQKYFLFSFNDSLHNNSKIMKQSVEKIKRNNSNLVSDELKFMDGVFSKAKYPKGMTEDEKNLYQQSLCVLKMAQQLIMKFSKRKRTSSRFTSSRVWYLLVQMNVCFMVSIVRGYSMRPRNYSNSFNADANY